MTDEQKAAYIHAQSVCALAEIEGMKAENMHREQCGNSVAYGYDEFVAVIKRYGIDNNAVMLWFNS